MRLEEYGTMRELEDTYWWHRGMRDYMEDILCPALEPGSRLLDVGCGTGGTLAMLSMYCDTAGIDIHPEAVRLSLQRGLENIVVGDATEMPYDDSTFTHATCSGVLQSVARDEACLGEIHRVLEPGGLLYVSEQSYPSLWNRHDVSQGAIRRYTRDDLQNKLHDAGFSIERFLFVNKTLMPPIAFLRLASKLLRPPRRQQQDEVSSDLFSLPRVINETLYRLFRMESGNRALDRLPAGLAMIALTSKPDTRVASEHSAKPAGVAS